MSDDKVVAYHVPARYLFLFKSFCLDATMHLYKRKCPSVRPFVRPSFRPSVGPSVCRSVGPVLFSNDKNRGF